jgi:hypothetical protein
MTIGIIIYIIGVLITGFLCTAHYIEYPSHPDFNGVAYAIIAMLWFVVLPLIILMLIGNLVHVFNAWLYITIKDKLKQKEPNE